MESRNDFGSKRERVKVSDEKAKEKEEKKAKVKKAPETVRLMLQRNLRLKYTGKKSGKLYVFSGAGAILPINKEDVEIMLEKRGGACCEGSGINKPQPYFVKV